MSRMNLKLFSVKNSKSIILIYNYFEKWEKEYVGSSHIGLFWQNQTQINTHTHTHE